MIRFPSFRRLLSRDKPCHKVRPTNLILKWNLQARSNATLAPTSLADPQRAIEQFNEQGVLVFEEKVSDNFVKKSKEMAENAFKDAIGRAEIYNREVRGYRVHDCSASKERMGVGKEFGFTEFVQRARGRFDMTWRISEQIKEEKFYQEEAILQEDVVKKIVGGILGDDYKLEFSGCLWSVPGGKEQLWHVDGEHLFNEVNTAVNSDILPCHCLNVFIPLVDVFSENGGTEFCLGSHMLTNKVKGSDIVWQREDWKDKIGAENLVRIQVQSGQILMFDYRLLHRALEHVGEKPRPVLYFTFCKRWFTDGLNFSGLPSLSEVEFGLSSSDDDRSALVDRWRNGGSFEKQSPTSASSCILDVESIREKHYRAGVFSGKTLADAAAGTQTPVAVINAVSDHLKQNGATNLGGEYKASEEALRIVRKARVAGAELLLGYPGGLQGGEEEAYTERIVFGLNCSSLLFHLSRCIEYACLTKSGLIKGSCIRCENPSNIVVSGACHDANVSPWLLLAQNLGLEVRWLKPIRNNTEDADALWLNGKEDDNPLSELVDEGTLLIAVGLASNASGRVHESLIKDYCQNTTPMNNGLKRPLLVIDATHYVPHRFVNIDEDDWRNQVDALVCSAYKYGGPHLGVMAFGAESPLASDFFPVYKYGLRPNSFPGEIDKDYLPAGMARGEGYEISRWELGTLPYEQLAGFHAMVQRYYKDLVPRFSSSVGRRSEDVQSVFERIQKHESLLSERFLMRFKELEEKFSRSDSKLVLHGSRNPEERTPTFAVSVLQNNQNASADLCSFLCREKRIYCTYGNHYAPSLVDGLGLDLESGWVRLSFYHYSTLADVDKACAGLEEFWEKAATKC